MLQVSSDQRGVVGQSDAGNQQVGATNLSQIPLNSKLIKSSCSGFVDGDNGKLVQVPFTLFQPFLCSLKLLSIGCLHQKVESATKDFDLADDRRAHDVCGCQDTFDESWMSRRKPCEGIRVEQIHESSSRTACPRWALMCWRNSSR